MDEQEMIRRRISGQRVCDIIAESGAPDWYVYDVMKRNSLSRMDKLPRVYTVVATTTKLSTVVARTAKEAKALASLDHPWAHKITVDRGEPAEGYDEVEARR